MHRGHISSRVLIVTLVLVSVVVDAEICCCPDLTVSLKCGDKNSESNPSIKTSLLKANGYVCDALEGSDVKLQCEVADKDHDAVKGIKYVYYKAYELNFNPVAYDSDDSKKAELSCDSTSSTCVLESVNWLGDSLTDAKFKEFDNFIYQCMVEVTLQDDSKFTISSNTMWLDVHKNVAGPPPGNVNVQKSSLNTGNPYERLECGPPPFPVTNPRSKAKWSYRKTDGDGWSSLNVLSHPRLALMEPEIAPEAEGSFLEGSLVLMLFDPHNDSGFYKCEVEYTATSVGENSIYDRALYEIVATNQQYQGSLENKMLSAVTSKHYVMLGEHVDFHCYARDVDASNEGVFSWVYEKETKLVTVEPGTMLLFKGVQILNNGRTLRLPIKYKYYGIKFKCKVSSQGVTIKSEEFLQPVVVPKVLYVPLTTKACLNSDTRINLQSNTKYMMSDGVDQPEDQYEQKLTGASFRWWIDDKYISVFTNSANKGGIITENVLGIDPELFTSTFAGTFVNQKCRYFSFLQTDSSAHGYQVVEVLKVTRPSDNTCADLDASTCSAMQLTRKCEEKKGEVVTEGSITVTLEGSSVQCLSVEVKTGGKLVFVKKFESVADTCSGRKLEMQITKSDTNQELLTGEYSVSVVPEGKTGCTKTINYDTAADCSPKTTTRDKLKSCPNQYYMDQDTKKPWSIKASTKCVFKAAEFTKFEIKPTEEACSDISIVSTETLERTDHKICSLDKELKDLTEGVNYEIHWVVSDTECKMQMSLQCNGCDKNSMISFLALLLPTLFLF